MPKADSDGAAGGFSPGTTQTGRALLHSYYLRLYLIDIPFENHSRKCLPALEFAMEFLYKKSVIPNQHRDPF